MSEQQPRHGERRKFRLTGTEWIDSPHREGQVVEATWDASWEAWEIEGGSEYFLHTSDRGDAYAEWGGDEIADEQSAPRMTARDFTPTDEQLEPLAAFWHDTEGRGEWMGAGVGEQDTCRRAVRDMTTLPAFQSIIAAAKAEARAEIVEELEAIDLIVPSETSEHEWGIDEATRAIIKLIRSKDEEATA